MQVIKKIKILVTILTFLILIPQKRILLKSVLKVQAGPFLNSIWLDDIVLEPLAKGYNKLPNPIKNGVGNFTSNIGTLLSIPNNILQGNFKQLGHSLGSFAINSTVGILGFLNPAEKIGLSPHKEDVGQTLGSYGLGPGCYFVLPVLGPTTARDSIGLIADTFIDPFAHVGTIREKELLGASGNSLDYYSVKITDAIDFRASNDKNLVSLEKTPLIYIHLLKVYIYKIEKIKLKTLLKMRMSGET